MMKLGVSTSQMPIQPLESQLQEQVISAAENYMQAAAKHYECDIPMVPVLFNLSGRAAGMYRVRRLQPEIRFNPYIFSKYFGENLKKTVPHEVAHYVVDVLHGARNVKPHGGEWREVMALFGVAPERTHDFNLEGVPQRKQNRVVYYCDCTEYKLSSTRHKRIVSGRAKYACHLCGKLLQINSPV